MGFLDELKKNLGLDDAPPAVDEEKLKELGLVGLPKDWKGDERTVHNMGDPSQFGTDSNRFLANQGKGDLVQKPEEDQVGVVEGAGPHLMVDPPPAKGAAFVNADKGTQWASDRDAAKAMAEASLAARDSRSARYSMESNIPGSSQLAELMKNGGDGIDADFAAGEAAQNRPKPRPVAAGPKSVKDQALEALRYRYGHPAEGPQPAPDNTETAAPPMVAAGGPPPTPPPEMDGGGNPIRSLMGKLATGAGGGEDPRVQGLRDALARSSRMKELANHVQGMGIGADLVEGTHVHGDQGKGLRDQADDEVRNAMLPTEFGQKNAKFDEEQATSQQNRSLKSLAEQRAESGDVRANAEEGRKAKGFETTQADTDPASASSKNARASIASLYPAQWGRIPQEVRDQFSAKDVMRIFGEVSLKETNAKAGGGLTPGQQMADDRAMRDFEEHLVQPGTVDAYRRIAGRLQSKEPLYGMGAGAKAIAATLGAVPVMGKHLADSATGALRGLTPEGQALYQDALRVMNQITLDTTGKAMNEGEREDIKTRIGMSAGDENAFRASILHEMDAARERADRQLAARNPRVQKMARERGIIPDWSPRGGGQMPYAYEAEGRLDDADAASKR